MSFWLQEAFVSHITIFNMITNENNRERGTFWEEINLTMLSVDMKVLDTRQHKDLLGTFISDMVLQLLSYVSENERLNIRQRQAEGIAAAKARGVRFGRPTLYPPDKYLDIFIRYRNKEISQTTAMHLIGCGNGTFYRLYHTLKASGKLH